jgi:hypothetical protein
MKKIRYTFEAEVDNNFPLSPLPMLGVNPPLISDDRTVYHTLGAVTISVEEVLPPEPEYRNGQIWQSKLGGVYLRVYGGWKAFGNASVLDDTLPSRPLKLLKDADPC